MTAELTLQGMINALSTLTVGETYKYASIGRSSTGECQLVSVDRQTGAVKYRRNSAGAITDETKVESITGANVEKLAVALNSRKPVEINALYGGSGNFRSALEALAANTAEIFVCQIDGKKHLLWMPGKSHPVGQITIASKSDDPIRREARDLEIQYEKKGRKPMPRQLITYGAPGTGKSHKVDGLAKNPDVAACVRTTFHPDSDYATFVGAYKPVMDGEKIAYKFRPQAFMNAYVKAWQEMAKPEADGKVKSVVLVIEEINRGNCAQIFGDLFQLLDRGKDGYSTYPIDADADLATWLAEELGKLDADAQERVPPEVRSGEKLVLPPNLYIWATMNTSDQSLFPIDSAFKRRWDWEYVPIAKPDKSGDSDWKERKIEVGDSLFDWWDFLSAINGHIAKATESEDKQLGYFFVKADDATGCISAEQFANKVLFYLYGDVFKSYELPKKDCFQQADNTVLKFRDFFYSEKVEEGEGENRVTHKPGDVKLGVVAAFLRGLKWKEKGVKEEPKGGAADANPD